MQTSLNKLIWCMFITEKELNCLIITHNFHMVCVLLTVLFVYILRSFTCCVDYMRYYCNVYFSFITDADRVLVDSVDLLACHIVY